jgi:protein-S-isoprenylcysteine O-methyltransferase Ste14
MCVASEFEFRHRMFVIAGIVALAFACSWIDSHSAAASLTGWLTALGVPAAGASGRHIVFFVAAGLVAGGTALRTWGTAYLDVETMMDARLRSQRLVIAGPYRYVRNPLYLGNLVVAVGLGLFASRIGFFVLVIGMTVFLYRLILREEQHLLREHGDVYRQFMAIPRLLPAWRARVPSSVAQPLWGRAAAGEILMWATAVATAIYAATFSAGAFWATVLAGAVAAGVRYRATGAWSGKRL